MSLSNTLYPDLASANILLQPEEELSQFFFSIEPILPYAMHSPEIALHVQGMKKLLRRCLAKEFQSNLQLIGSQLISKLPLLDWSVSQSAPGSIGLTVLCLSSKEHGTENKLENIIKGCLVLGKFTNILSMQSLYFHWNFFPDKSFLIMEIKALIENEKDLSRAVSHLPSLSTQICSSLKNHSAFSRFFSHRPFLQESKCAQTYQEITLLIEKFPHLFTMDLFQEMGCFFSLCSSSFFDPRSSRLITRILACHYLMRMNFHRLLPLYPEKKHITTRYVRTDLDFRFGSKPVLGLILAVAPLDKHECFEESHILQAAQFLVPEAEIVKGSFYRYQGLEDPICTLYVEFEKKNGARFSQAEMRILKEGLEEELKRRIEKLVPSIFMTRNEEETMRNILLLSQELQYLSDLPQAIISLDAQTTADLSFTVILVRLTKPNQAPLSKDFEPLKAQAEFLSDRIQQIGFLRKNHPKEANVFHLRIPKDPSLLRVDSSVNFYLARNRAVSIVQQAIGPFRDYNGGMILKQGELLYQFKDAFPEVAEKNLEILEDFFFSLNPIEIQATLPLSSLEFLFCQFLEAKKVDLSQKEHYFLKIEEKKEHLFVMIRTQDTSFKETLQTFLIRNEYWTKSLIYSSIVVHGSLYTGIILLQSDAKKHQAFITSVYEAIRSWKESLQNQQILKLSFGDLPQSLDPRLAGDELSSTVAKMLFEGLTRMGKNGDLDLAVAESVDISEDLKHYLFKLKTCYWSDGSQVTAHDFEYAWKKVLSPNFVSPFAYTFYPIKNAKLAKKDLCPMDKVGVRALDDITLSVELEFPTPEFLELATSSLFSPIPRIVDKIHPNWSLKGSQNFICNGPFFPSKTALHNRYEFAKNPFYWDKDAVALEQIHLSKDNASLVNDMFKNEEIHWLGKPMCPWEESFSDNNSNLEVSSAAVGVYWCIFNTKKFPFNNPHLRKAFDLAIDRQDLVSSTSHNFLPASTPLPLQHTMNYCEERIYGDEQKALELFELALQELGLTRSTFPLVSINFVNTPIREKAMLYVTNRWRKLFQIPCRLEGLDLHPLITKIIKEDFQIAGMHWKPLIDSPNYTLGTFEQGEMGASPLSWDHPEYQKLLVKAREELNLAQKVKCLSDAEKLLITEAPIVSLFYEKEKYMKKPCLRRILYSKNTGIVDFKYAYIDQREKNKENASEIVMHCKKATINPMEVTLCQHNIN
jgi:oligopeptide transport system substrate-binding protein